ncbi:M2 family metallopeptidase [Porticoccaceae bacterium]|nr:M2 family metallopeptidase [Porticoccaceae bacterium]MDA9583910.1 M2 family metallopeptidase [Porticoccaceae bacterium]MDB2400647.1 M2 family metallopeptidase [Porticoccaceae bacterium]MDB2558243.1 M2 family metallopeptidase [Porticoccaceae bacterium]
MNSKLRVIALVSAASLVIGCGQNNDHGNLRDLQPTETAKQFVSRIEEEGGQLNKEVSAAYWVRSTYITPDTAILAAKAGERALTFESNMVKQAKQFRSAEMDTDTARAIELMLRGSSAPAPNDPALRAELSAILTDMEGQYGVGKYCNAAGECRELQELESVLAKSRDYDELLDVWSGWRQVSPPYRQQYQRFVEIGNQGAKDFGYSNLADLWQGGYDMESDAFVKESRRLWGQVKPFYDELHCYVRGRLSDTYGVDKVPNEGLIPAHLLGNMWSQTWDNVYDIAEPYSGVASLDVTAALIDQGYDELEMTQTAESFFTSLGLPALPDSFYQNSMIKKPRDRNVVCHASAWDIDNGNDPRIKQCVEINEEQLETLHHELGHIYYYLMYKDQPSVFKGGAHDGFHEAIGDTIQLSMTPAYLKEKGLISETVESYEATINKQMKMALQKIAFLPFGKMIDEWRWQVFSGEIAPEDYNAGWWRLREEYQGIAAPVARSEADFDAGAKYHIPGNTPYTRYFLSFIMQFQFHKALCNVAGFKGPLHECSIYDNKAAGKKLGDMLAMGQSKPWPEAMNALTGQRGMDGSAIIDYFAPLNAWLKSENEGQQCGW